MFNYKKLQVLTKDQLEGNILEVSKTIEIAPVIIIRHILKLEGLSKRAIKETIEGTIPPPQFLKESLEIALQNDPVFSPKGISHSKKRGKLGEELIMRWLDFLSREYTRDLGQGGPDFVLKEPIKLDLEGKLKEFDWIESKASYGDAFKVKRDSSQFRKYADLGRGLIFYWYGIVPPVEWDIFTWKNLMKLVNKSLKARIKRFIAFVPYEFKHLL